jgi:hypothetical protein
LSLKTRCTTLTPTPSLLAILLMPMPRFRGLRIAVKFGVSRRGGPSFLPCAFARPKHDRQTPASAQPGPVIGTKQRRNWHFINNINGIRWREHRLANSVQRANSSSFGRAREDGAGNDFGVTPLDLTMPVWRVIGGEGRGRDVCGRFLSDVTPPELQSPRFQ